MLWINRVNTVVTLLLSHPHCLPYAGEERQLSRGEHSQAFWGEQTLHSLTQPNVFLWSPTGSFYVLLHQRGLTVRETHVGPYRVLRKKHRAAWQQRSDEEHPKRGTHQQWSWVTSHCEVLAALVLLGIDGGSMEQHWKDLLPHSSTANVGIIV